MIDNADEYSEEVRPTGEDLLEEGSFDELAKGLASGAISRHRALKLVGAGILGTIVVGLVPGMADAKKKKKKKKKKHHTKRCPGQTTCPASAGGGCCPVASPICCPVSTGGGCCDADQPLCCPVSTGGGCCDVGNPVCCSDGMTCCPAGTTCTAEGTCLPTSGGQSIAASRGTRR